MNQRLPLHHFEYNQSEKKGMNKNRVNFSNIYSMFRTNPSIPWELETHLHKVYSMRGSSCTNSTRNEVSNYSLKSSRSLPLNGCSLHKHHPLKSVHLRSLFSVS